MDAQEYNARVGQWAQEVRGRMRANLDVMTHPFSGGLRRQLSARTIIDYFDGEAHRVAFRFLRYGVFVAYGAGRGYNRIDGRLVRTASTPGGMRRSPKDWFDSQIAANLDRLADLAGEYYGDRSMEAVLRQLDRMTIVKRRRR